MTIYIDRHTCTHTCTHTRVYTHILEYFLAVKKKHFTTFMSFERIILRGKKCTRLHIQQLPLYEILQVGEENTHITTGEEYSVIDRRMEDFIGCRGA